MKSRCNNSSDFRPQAFTYGHWRPRQCSCAFTYRSQQKGENAVTRDYYQLTHEIAKHGAVMEQGEKVRDCELFSIRERLNSFWLNTWQTPAKKHISSTVRAKHLHANIRQQNHSCLPQLILCYFKFTHMKYVRFPLRSFFRYFHFYHSELWIKKNYVYYM